MEELRPFDSRVSFCVRKVIEAEASLAAVRATLSELQATQTPTDKIGAAAKDDQVYTSEKNANAQPALPRFASNLPEIMDKSDQPKPEDAAQNFLQLSRQISGDMWDTNASRVPVFSTERSGTRSNWATIDNSHALRTHALLDQVIIDALDHPPELPPLFGEVEDAHGHSKHKKRGTLAKAWHRAKRKHMPHISRFLSSHVYWVKVGSCFWPMLHPEAKFRILWMLLGFWFIMFEAFTIPYNMAFAPPDVGVLRMVTNIINGFFVLDVIMTFVTAIMEDNGNIEARPHVVARRYICGWFVPDVMSAIPWEWVTPGEKSGPQALTRGFRFFRAFRLLRLTRLVHMMRLKKALDKVEAYVESSRAMMFSMGLIRIFLIIFGITHWGACVWYIVGSTDNEVTWISEKMPPEINNLGQQYVYCLYFTLTTMTTVGYGDITPVNYDEVLYCLLLLLIASIVFAGQMGTLSELISSTNYHNRQKSEKKMTLSRYMTWRVVPRLLTMTIRQHMIFKWDNNEGHDDYEDWLKGELPPVLKTELCYHIYGQILANAPFLSFLKDYSICLKQLSCMVQTMFLAAGDLLFRVGDPNEQIYMLLSGRVWMSRNENLFDKYLQAQEDNQRRHGAGPKMDENNTAFCDKNAFHIPRRNDKKIHLNKSTKVPHGHNHAHHYRRYRSLTLATDSLFHRRGSKLVDSSDNIFAAEAFVKAANKLKAQDIQEHDAAVMVQRRWRKRHARLMRKKTMEQAKGVQDDNGSTRNGPNGGVTLNHLHSKCICAPAYFGESCLWVEFEKWSEQLPPKYLYSAQCMDRCEFVYVARFAIAELLNHFAPWLVTRFETFRQEATGEMDREESRREQAEGNERSKDFMDAHDELQATTASKLKQPIVESNLNGAAQPPMLRPAGPETSTPHLMNTPAMPPEHRTFGFDMKPTGSYLAEPKGMLSSLDWSAADAELPKDDVSFNDNHRRHLSRNTAPWQTPVTPWSLREARKEESACCGPPMVMTSSVTSTMSARHSARHPATGSAKREHDSRL